MQDVIKVPIMLELVLHDYQRYRPKESKLPRPRMQRRFDDFVGRELIRWTVARCKLVIRYRERLAQP